MQGLHDLIEEARRIAAQIESHCIPTRHGHPAWIGPAGYGTELIPLQAVQLGPHLYGGTLGIALFFAALASVDNNLRWRDFCLRVIAPLRQRLTDLADDTERANKIKLPVGGLIGLGSFIYSFTNIGQLIGEPELLQEAHVITELVTDERIIADQRVRLQTGCAGTILALIALHRKIARANRHGKTPLDLAVACASHIIDKRISFDGRPRAWSLSPGKPPLMGFAYGAAGISFSLLRLYSVTGQRDLWDAAQEGLAFVQSLYSIERKSWRDTRGIFQARYRPRRGTWKDWWATGDRFSFTLCGRNPAG